MRRVATWWTEGRARGGSARGLGRHLAVRSARRGARSFDAVRAVAAERQHLACWISAWRSWRSLELALGGRWRARARAQRRDAAAVADGRQQQQQRLEEEEAPGPLQKAEAPDLSQEGVNGCRCRRRPRSVAALPPPPPRHTHTRTHRLTHSLPPSQNLIINRTHVQSSALARRRAPTASRERGAAALSKCTTLSSHWRLLRPGAARRTQT